MLVRSYSSTSNRAPNRSCQRCRRCANSAVFVRQQLVQAAVERILLHQRIILRPADPPSRSARTTAGASATRCPDRSADSTPASAGCAASTCLRAKPASGAPRTDPVQAAHKVDRPASTLPIAAADAVPSHRAAPARHSACACSGTARSAGNNASCVWRWLPSSNASIDPHQASRWLSLISPRYSTCRCTTLAASTALALDNIPIAMFFAVFEASVEPQEHANQLTQNRTDEKILGLHYRRFASSPFDTTHFLTPSPHQNRCRRARVEKVGLELAAEQYPVMPVGQGQLHYFPDQRSRPLLSSQTIAARR